MDSESVLSDDDIDGNNGLQIIQSISTLYENETRTKTELEKLQKAETKGKGRGFLLGDSADSIITLNLSGYRYQMTKSSFLKLPIVTQILSRSIPIQTKENEVEYFLGDSDPSCFMAVISFLKNKGGRLHIPKNICKNIFKKEVGLWDIDIRELCSSCYIEYASFTQEQDSGREFFNSRRKTNFRRIIKDMEPWRRKIYLLVNIPKSSRLALLYKWIMVFAVVTSVAVSVISTSSEIRTELTDEQWREYYLHDKDEIQELCNIRENRKGPELRDFCNNNKDFLSRKKRSFQSMKILLTGYGQNDSYMGKTYFSPNSNDYKLDIENQINVLESEEKGSIFHHNSSESVYLEESPKRTEFYEDSQLDLIEKPLSLRVIQTTNKLNHYVTRRMGKEQTEHKISKRFIMGNGHRPSNARNLSFNSRPTLFLNNMLRKLDDQNATNLSGQNRASPSGQSRLNLAGRNKAMEKVSLGEFIREHRRNMSCTRLRNCIGLPEGLSAPSIWLYVIDALCIFVFIVDYVLHFLSHTNKKKYVLSLVAVMELLVILVFFAFILKDLSYPRGKYDPIYEVIFAFVKMANLFKLGQMSMTFKALVLSMKHSCRDVFNVLTILTVLCTVLASILYSLEKENMQSVPNALYFVFITMTTVGYGDIYAETSLGKFVSTLAAIGGLFVLPIVVPIFVYTFGFFYSTMKNSEYMDGIAKSKLRQKMCLGAVKMLVEVKRSRGVSVGFSEDVWSQIKGKTPLKFNKKK